MLHFADHHALRHRLVEAKREVVFLVGSALNTPGQSWPGVAGVEAMIQRIRAVFEHAAKNPNPIRAKRMRDALAELDQLLAVAKNRYQTAFQFLMVRCGVEAANDVVRCAVLEAMREPQRVASSSSSVLDTLELEPGAWHLSPATEALGRLAARYPERFGRVVLTTNFDPLLSVAIRKARGNARATVLIGDGSLETSRGEGTHVVHAHGYWHGIDALHTPAALEQERPQLRASLRRLCQQRIIVVLGYGGWEDAFTQTLAEVAADPGANADVLWCFYHDDPDTIREANPHVLDVLRPAIDRRAHLFRGIDCHKFLPELLHEVDRDAAFSDERVVGRGALISALLEALDKRHAVQLLGERQMGKSSVLRWMQQRIPDAGWSVASIDCFELARPSPVSLARAVGRALEREQEVLETLYTDRATSDAAGALRALELFLPLRLIVDNAELLAAADHRFTPEFFDFLFSLQQNGKFQWISASQTALSGRFGMASEFLIDAQVVIVGALDEAEVAKVFAEHLGEEHVDRALELGGTLPAAMRWLMSKRGAFTSDPEALEQRFRTWMRPLFSLWWSLRNEDEKQLLVQAAHPEANIHALSEMNRVLLDELGQRGLIVLDGDRFRPNGAAWRDHIAPPV